MSSVKLVIFDLDDTLVATKDAVIHARHAVLQGILGLTNPIELSGAQAAWQRLTWYFSAEDRAAIFKALCRDMGRPEPAERECEALQRQYEDVMAATLRLSLGAETALTSLKSTGVTIGIVSTGIVARQRRKIDLTGLSRWIQPDLIIIDEPGSPSAKPQPTSILALCRALGVEPADAAIVGDRATDIIAGNLARCRTVLYYGGPLEVRSPAQSGILSLEIPQHSVRRLADLPQLLFSTP